MMSRRDRSSLDHGNREAWWLGAAIAVLILTLAAVIGVGTKEISDARHAATARAAITDALHDQVECVAAWADTFSLRVDQQTGADAARLAALDALVRALQHGTPTRWHHALHRYLAASDAYNRQVKTHPLPAAPKFLCNQLDSLTLPSPSVVTVTPRPSTTTRTITRTARPSATPTPGPTVTVTRPGRTRTVTRTGPTRTVAHPAPTVTVTRTCLPHLTGILC